MRLGNEIMYDLLVIGGGINGVGIARDAAGRGLKTALCEKDDLASHTSSASSKLIHGGLRYLENYEFRLVRESLGERETLLRAAPHIIWPIRIVLPVEKGMRPAWMLRIGLFIYDNLAKRALLPSTKTLNLRSAKQGEALKEHLVKGFEYSDCWADDARLVALNAMDAAHRGADIRTHTECIGLERHADHWSATLKNDQGMNETINAKMIINAAGPWVDKVLGKVGSINNASGVRLVKGSHIIVDKLYDGDHAYLFQSPDGRVIFSMPYENHYTLIGTTEAKWELENGEVHISDEETNYLCGAVNEYFQKQITPDDVIWSYAGVRPLYDDKSDNASTVTRDYVFNLEEGDRAPMLSIYGGKLTTYRKLSEHAMEKISHIFPNIGAAWTKGASLPGGDIEFDALPALKSSMAAQYSWLDSKIIHRMVDAYGTKINAILEGKNSIAEMGHDYGAGLYEAEIAYMEDHEFAKSMEAVLWRRSKLGLHMSDAQIKAVEARFAQKTNA